MLQPIASPAPAKSRLSAIKALLGELTAPIPWTTCTLISGMSLAFVIDNHSKDWGFIAGWCAAGLLNLAPALFTPARSWHFRDTARYWQGIRVIAYLEGWKHCHRAINRITKLSEQNKDITVDELQNEWDVMVDAGVSSIKMNLDLYSVDAKIRESQL